MRLATLVLIPTLSAGLLSALSSGHKHASAFQNQRKIVKATSGTLALVYQQGSGGLTLAVSRDRGATWTDRLSLPGTKTMYADAFIAPDNDIYLVYGSNRDTAGTVNDIGFAELAYEAGSDDWVLANQTLVFDAGATDGAFNAVIGRDDAFLWAGYRYYDGSRYSFRVRYSADEGNSWHDAIVADTPGTDKDETGAFVRFGDRLGLTAGTSSV